MATIVDECSDTDQADKPPWKTRKKAYIAHLGGAGDATILVSLADKLDNARAILRDYRLVKEPLWQRFSVNDPQEHLLYYESLLAEYRKRNRTWLVAELDRVLTELRSLVEGSARA